MDDACGLGRGSALGDRPGARFLRPCRKIGDQPEEAVARCNKAVEPGLFQPQLVEKQLAFLLVQMRKFGLDLRRDYDDLDSVPRKRSSTSLEYALPVSALASSTLQT